MTDLLTARLQPRSLTEKQWQDLVIEIATGCGWMHYHPYDSRRSTAGFPDLTLLRNGRLIFAELKTQGEKPTVAQETWLREMRNCLGVGVYVWRPADLALVERILA